MAWPPPRNRKDRATTMIRRSAFVVCLSLSVLPALPLGTTAADDGASVTDAAAATYRIYYLLAPGQQHLGPAMLAYGVSRGTSGVAWLGAHAGSAAWAPPFRTPVADLLAGAGTSPAVAAAVRRWQADQAAAGDLVVVENRLDGRVTAGPGRDFVRVADAAGLAAVAFSGPRVSTDVGFTTWGKVKDLFR